MDLGPLQLLCLGLEVTGEKSRVIQPLTQLTNQRCRTILGVLHLQLKNTSHETATTACTSFSPIFWELFGAWPENILLMDLEGVPTLGHNLNFQNVKEKEFHTRFQMAGSSPEQRPCWKNIGLQPA